MARYCGKARGGEGDWRVSASDGGAGTQSGASALPFAPANISNRALGPMSHPGAPGQASSMLGIHHAAGARAGALGGGSGSGKTSEGNWRWGQRVEAEQITTIKRPQILPVNLLAVQAKA